jgi:CAAX prenyl protease-like protein
MAYIALLGLTYAVPPVWQPVTIAVRGAVSIGVVWLVRRQLPPWGAACWPIAVAGGIMIGWGWVVGQDVFDQLGLGGRLPLMPGEKAPIDPRTALGASTLFWWTWWLRMIVACTAVPVVEEIFWRAFLLRALIDWHHFERVPLGRFTWVAFLGTSLISTLQHPDNWGVSVLCWMAFNGVFYWTRSLLCAILLHGFTNLVLYFMVLRVADWSFW